MRNKIFSFLLISVFLISSLPLVQAQEVVETAGIEEALSAPSDVLPETEIAADEPDIETEPVAGLESLAAELVAATTTGPEEITVATTSEESVAWTIATTIDLPNGCAVTDASGITHIFPTATSTEYLAICALAEAVENGSISEFTVQNASFGLYVTSVDGAAAASDEFWALWVNGGFATCGLGCLPLAENDSLSFVRTTFSGEESDRLTITIGSLVDEFDNIFVPDKCGIVDTSGVAHTFPGVGSAGEHLAACALTAAVSEGHLSGFEATDSSFGLFVTSVDGVAASANQFWALWTNGGFASCGIACLPLEIGDTFSLVLTTFDGQESERADLRVIGFTQVPDAEPDNPDGGSGGAPTPDADAFDVPAAYSFLASGQQEDGSWDSDFVTDWSAIALAISGAPSSMKSALADYLRNEDVDLDTVRDYERHAMALMALNINPYTGGPEDYITPIVESFDGTQIDDPAIVNDDAFALIVLMNAGYNDDDEIIRKIAAFIVSEQRNDGSWEGGIDLSGPYIQALSGVSSLPGVDDALERAEGFLRSSQESDGGFGDPFSTAWTIQGIEALGQSPGTWEQGDNTPLTYLVELQDEDGGIVTDPSDYFTRAWATAYAIPAVKGVTWDQILRDFQKQEPPEGEEGEDNDSEGEVAGVATTTEVSTLPAPLETEAFFATAPTSVADTAETDSYTVEPETNVVVAQSDAEPAPEQESAPLAAAGAETGAWEWLKKLFATIWSAIVGLFT